MGCVIHPGENACQIYSSFSATHFNEKSFGARCPTRAIKIPSGGSTFDVLSRFPFPNAGTDSRATGCTSTAKNRISMAPRSESPLTTIGLGSDLSSGVRAVFYDIRTEGISRRIGRNGGRHLSRYPASDGHSIPRFRRPRTN